jgi:hypothetical protein
LAQVGAKSVIESVSVLHPTCAKPLAQFWRFLFHFWRFGVNLFQDKTTKENANVLQNIF